MKTHIIRFSIVVICLLFSLTVTFSQEAVQRINYGEVATVIISDEQTTLTFEFEGVTGDQIQISTRAVNEPVYASIDLFTPAGTYLESAFDGALGSILAPYTLPRDGVYSFTVQSAEWSDTTGEIEVSVNRVEPTPLTIGETLTDTLTGFSDMRIFTFEGVRGAVITTTIEAENDVLGVSVASPSDPYFNSFDAIESGQLPVMILPEEGMYTVYLQTSQADATPFALTIDEQVVMPLTDGETLTGTLIDGQAQVYSFEAIVDSVWNVDTLFADGGYGSWLEIYPLSDSTSVYAADYGSGANGAPRIRSFIAPASDTYYIVLQLDDGDMNRLDYELTLSETKLASIVIGQTVNSTVDPETGNVVINYQGRIDDHLQITFEVTGGDGEPGLTLYSPDDSILSYFARGGRNASFDIVLRQDGLYQIVIYNVSYAEGTTLDFMLRLDEAE